MFPTPKYQGLREIDGIPVTWRANVDGYPTPIKDTPQYLEKERKEAAEVVLNAQSKFFTLPEDNDAYTKTIDWIANGLAILRSEEKTLIEKDGVKKWWVWVVYLDLRGMVPTDRDLSMQLAPDAVPTRML